MRYKKPNMKYTTMAMRFDEHIHDKDRNDEELFRYVYHIMYMLACKHKYFHKYEDFDGYAMFAAQRIYLRAISPENNNGERIKSILNYCKSVKYPMKVDYQREEFINDYSSIDTDNTQVYRGQLENNIQSEYSQGLREDIADKLKQITKFIDKVVLTTPYRNDIIICRRLKMSILLTFLSSVTLCNYYLNKVRGTKDDIEQIIKQSSGGEVLSNVITWMLDDTWRDYVYVLTIRVKKLLGKDLTAIDDSYKLSSDDMSSIIMGAYYEDKGYTNTDDIEE